LCIQGEIDAREDSFKSAMEAGNRLLESDHYAADDVRDKVITLKNCILGTRFGMFSFHGLE